MPFKIRLVFSIPGKPQGRGRVERFFRTINEMFLCDLEGYTGKGRRKPGLTLGQLDERFRTFLLDIYHRRRSSRGRLAPTERWEKGGFLPRMPEGSVAKFERVEVESEMSCRGEKSRQRCRTASL
jgi:putative transposase